MVRNLHAYISSFTMTEYHQKFIIKAILFRDNNTASCRKLKHSLDNYEKSMSERDMSIITFKVTYHSDKKSENCFPLAARYMQVVRGQ